MVLLCRSGREKRQEGKEKEPCETPAEHPIWVMESPVPTRPWSSPPPSTPTLARRRRVLMRGGFRRSEHRRHNTVALNPRKPHHFGCEAILRAVGRSTTTRSIKKLRVRTAAKITEWYFQGATVRGINVKEAIDDTNLPIEDYAMQAQGRQWASVLEMIAASRCIKLSVSLQIKKTIIKEGDMATKNSIQLRKNHYVHISSSSGSTYKHAQRRRANSEDMGRPASVSFGTGLTRSSEPREGHSAPAAAQLPQEALQAHTTSAAAQLPHQTRQGLSVSAVAQLPQEARGAQSASVAAQSHKKLYQSRRHRRAESNLPQEKPASLCRRR